MCNWLKSKWRTVFVRIKSQCQGIFFVEEQPFALVSVERILQSILKHILKSGEKASKSGKMRLQKRGTENESGRRERERVNQEASF